MLDVHRLVLMAIGAAAFAGIVLVVIEIGIRVVDRVERRAAMRRWPSAWTRIIWAVPCPTCSVPAWRLCLALDTRPGILLEAVPHPARIVSAGVARECQKEAIRAYCGDVFFLEFGKRPRRQAEDMVARTWPVETPETPSTTEPRR